MARAHYVYVVKQSVGGGEQILSAHTVKHEMISLLKKLGPDECAYRHIEITRMRDGVRRVEDIEPGKDITKEIMEEAFEGAWKAGQANVGE